VYYPCLRKEIKYLSHPYNEFFELLAIIRLKEFENLLLVGYRIYSLAFIKLSLDFKHLFTQRLPT
jgi:hypothetical protein